LILISYILGSGCQLTSKL